MKVQKMSDKFKIKLKSILNKTKLPNKNLVIKPKFSGLLHFAEVKIYDMKGPKDPVITISIDKPNDTAKRYFASGVYFYSDFSMLSPKLLVSIQWLVRHINTQMK